jgi:hypothetical protein
VQNVKATSENINKFLLILQSTIPYFPVLRQGMIAKCLQECALLKITVKNLCAKRRSCPVFVQRPVFVKINFSLFMIGYFL